MKTCTSCGQSSEEGANICAACSAKVDAESAPVQTTKKNDKIDFNFPKNNGLVSNDEYVVATLANGVVSNLISGEGFKTEGAVLTNKRLYYTHKTGIVNIHTQEEKVNVKDITGTKIANFNPVGLLIMQILAMVAGIALAIIAEEEEMLVALLPAALLFLIVYFVAKKSHLRIEYAGGAIYFSVRKYGKESVQKFQKCIYAVKDHLEAKDASKE